MLTARQKILLQAIISEFIDTAQAVGSIDLPDKYQLKVSPATIRNEMARLVNLGYLEKPHASSGRIPTTLAFRYFLQDLLEELDEIDIKQRSIMSEDMFQKRYNLDQLILSALRALNELTHNTAVALIQDKIYHAGLDDLLSEPEFQNIDRLKHVLAIIEDYSEMANILGRYQSDDAVRVLIGEETGQTTFENTAIVFSAIPVFGMHEGYIAIIGPSRMNYKKVLPALKYVSETIRDILKDWKGY